VLLLQSIFIEKYIISMLLLQSIFIEKYIISVLLLQSIFIEKYIISVLLLQSIFIEKSPPPIHNDEAFVFLGSKRQNKNTSEISKLYSVKVFFY